MKVNSKNRGFVEGTLVLMADGKQKPIEKIQAGDFVLSFDEFDAYAPLEPMEVTNTFSRIDNNVLEVKTENTVLKVAQNQMFIGPHNDWKEVYEHSLVVDVDGNPVDYVVNKISKGKHRIYDITVDENHSLIANGIRVHNIVGSGSASGNVKTGTTTGSTSSGPSSPMGGQGTSFGGSKTGASNYNKGVTGSIKAGNNPSGSQKSTAANTKTTNTTQKGPVGTNANGGGGGKTQSKSAGGGMSNANGGLGQGGQNNGVGNRGSTGGNGQNSEHKKFVKDVAAVGFKKKKSKTPDEPAPKKPSGVSVGIKLIETIENTVDVLQELVSSLTPAQLTSSKISIQAGIDSIYSFANEYVAAMYAAEMQVSDKTYLIQSATNMMNNAAEMRNPFEATVVSAQGKSIALLHLSVIESEVARVRNKLNVYTVDDGRGELQVTVNNVSNSKIKKIAKTKRNKQGKWTTTKGA
jgi:hypothetical protein